MTSTMPELEGVTHQYVDAEGLKVHVAIAKPVDPADDVHPPVVLVHGWPQHWWCWHHVMLPLAQDRTVVAVDLRGHGWTDAPASGYDKMTLADDLYATIIALGLGKVDLVGHDWGGWTSLLLAQHHPEVVNRVVSLAIPAPWSGVPLRNVPPFVYMPLAAGPWGPWLHRSGGQALIRAIYRMGTSREGRLSAAELEIYLERYRQPDRARAGALFYRTFLTQEVRPLLRRTYSPGAPKQPILMLAGTRDPVSTPAYVKSAIEPGSDITFAVVKGSGHFIPEEQPDVVLEHVRRFLNQASPLRD
jgi:pimeloyl-ACP methyl ester carboxylesterase